MIILTGATGALGGAALDHLLARVPADHLAVVARDPDRASRFFADRGVEVRRGDYAEPESLLRAFAGADRLLLVSTNDPRADAVGLHRAALEAAVEAGVGRVLYTSHQAAAPDNPFFPGRDHHATEQLLAASGLAWTSLRNGFYAHSLQWLAGPWRETGEVVVPHDGPVSWTARSDAAEAAAVLLSQDAELDGPVTLTAGEAPTFADVARLASEVSGRRIGFRVVPEDEWVGALVATGQPPHVADALLGFFRAARDGYFAGTDPLLARLLGREPSTACDALGAQAQA